MFTLAYLSDPHLAPLPRPALHELMNKRLLGYLNWLRSRKGIHSRRVLDALTADLLVQSPDHIAVGGDLINLALRDEFANALDWLQTLGSPEQVSTVPGNHDTYVSFDYTAGIGLWEAYMTSDAGRITEYVAREIIVREREASSFSYDRLPRRPKQRNRVGIVIAGFIIGILTGIAGVLSFGWQIIQ